MPERAWQPRLTADRETGGTDGPGPVSPQSLDAAGGLSTASPVASPATPPGLPPAAPPPAPSAAGPRSNASDHDDPAGRPDSAAPPRLTARGAGLAMFSVFFPGTLAAGWLHLAALTGLSFLAGCVVAGRYAKRADLLVVVTMPPMIFLIAVICAKAISATGNTLISTAEGCILTLSSVAPWLFGGVAAILFIALFRGLPQAVSEFRDALRGHLDSGDPSDPGDRRDPGEVRYRR